MDEEILSCIRCGKEKHAEDEDLGEWLTIDEKHDYDEQNTYYIAVCPECRDNLEEEKIHFQCVFCNRIIDEWSQEEVTDISRGYAIKNNKIVQDVVCSDEECKEQMEWIKENG